MQKPKRVVDTKLLQSIGRHFLLAIGEDPDAPGLRDTPLRFARLWAEFIEYSPGNKETAFGCTNTDQMIVISGMKVWSVCQHHLLPFTATVAIGYIPKKGRILGLSKFARIAHEAAHRLQVQEQLVQDIANEVVALSQSKDVGVIAQGHHLCMEMRGIKTQGLMTCSVMYGAFRKELATRQEFFNLARKQNSG